jgi:hypothetical protein
VLSYPNREQSSIAQPNPHGIVNDLLAELIDRWQCRVEPRSDQGEVYWHILLGDDPNIRALAGEARQRLAQFEGLRITMERWLHVTTLIVGSRLRS